MRIRAVVAVVSALIVPATLIGPTTVPVAHATAQTAVVPFPDGITWLGGPTRYDTAVAVSKRHEPGVPAVFLASGSNFPDAVSAASAAALAGGPLLLTPAAVVPPVVLAELRRLQPQRIYVVGGASVVSESVRAAVARVAPTTRLSGIDRYATGRAVVRSTFTAADHAMIATGRNFPDALAASGAAGAREAPVVLVDGAKSTVDSATLAQLRSLGVTSVAIAGGPGAVSTAIQSQLSAAGYAVTRFGGASRYQTAALINRAYFPTGSSTSTILATGADFPDALAGAALAGRLAAPLNITARTCVDPAVADAIDEVGATSRVVLGDTSVVSNAAAANTRCVYPITGEPLDDWAVTEWTMARDAPSPYIDRPPYDVHSSSIRLDSTGLWIYSRPGDGVRSDQPVDYAQYGISAFLEYRRTGDRLWLDRAVRQAERLTEIRVLRDGAWWFPYRHPWTYDGRTLTPPWFSAMAQGESLSLFVYLAQETGEARWNTAADRTWASLIQPYTASGPWGTLVIDDHLYFETFAGDQPPLLVMNGHIFASFGAYDYWRHTGDPTAARFFNGAWTTVAERMLPAVRVPGSASYYCVQAVFCQRPRWQNQPYHLIHIWQLDTLARITGDTAFAEWAQLLRTDWSP